MAKVYEDLEALACVWSYNDLVPNYKVPCYSCDGYMVTCKEYTPNEKLIREIVIKEDHEDDYINRHRD